MEHKEINFSPYATNVIDCLDRTDLVTPDGQAVNISQSSGPYGIEFHVDIGDRCLVGHNNWDASYILNSLQVGTNR